MRLSRFLMQRLRRNQRRVLVLAGCWLQNPDGSEQRGRTSLRAANAEDGAVAKRLGLHRIFKMKRLNENATAMPRERRLMKWRRFPAPSWACAKRDFDLIGGLDPEIFFPACRADLDL